MFARVSHQKARDERGNVVQIASRNSVEYISLDERVTIYADFTTINGAATAALYIETVKAYDAGGLLVVAANLQDVLAMIAQGLAALAVAADFIE